MFRHFLLLLVSPRRCQLAEFLFSSLKKIQKRYHTPNKSKRPPWSLPGVCLLNVRNKLAADRPNQLPAPPPDRRGCLPPSHSSRVLIIGLADGLASFQWSLSLFLAPNWQPSSNSIDATSHLTLATLWHYPRRDQTHSFCQVENLLAISLFSSSSSSSFVLFLIESALKIIRCVGEFNGLQMRFRKAKERERKKVRQLVNL